MLVNVTPTDVKEQVYFECALEDSTEHVTKLALELHNFVQYLKKLADLLRDLKQYGQLRAPEARGLDEAVEGERLGPDQDKQRYRDGFRPNERGQELLQTCLDEIKKVTADMPAARTPVTPADLENVLATVKGSLMIIYPEGLAPAEALREALAAADEYRAGHYADDGFINVDAGAVFFAGRPLLQRGETMRCLNAPETSTIKLVPSRSASYAPRSHGDRADAEMMRFLYLREQERKKAELMTGDDVYGREWADPGAMKKQMQGIGEIRFR